MRKSLVILVLAALAVALVAGCGGDSDSDSDSGDASALTKSQFIKQGDAICSKIHKEQLANMEAYGKKNPNSLATKSGQEAVVIEVALPPINKAADGLDALGAPEGDEEEIDAFIQAMEELVEEGEGNPATLLEEGTDPFEEVNDLARAYGFKVCSEPL